MDPHGTPDASPLEPARPGAPVTRRRLLQVAAAAGAGSLPFVRALEVLAAASPGRKVTEKTVRQAEWIAGLSLDEAQRKLMVAGLQQYQDEVARVRAVPLDNSVPPAFLFRPAAVESPAEVRSWDVAPPLPAYSRPAEATDADVAFAPLATLAGLLRGRALSSVELARLYLERLRRFDPLLHCVVTLTEERALRQAEEADRELAAGRPRGPLHGVPWGAKDLLAVPGYPTTWGAGPFREQVRGETAAAVERLDGAGAPLLAKLSVGELAWGDEWFGGKTRSPWRPEEGSSGSSAGSAAAVAAGLVGFALGTETWGSIVSPCTRCGATGLRPTYGRVSRHGAMTLAWTMDKLGPIARTAEDCALVFQAIQGADPRDPASVDRPFAWPWKGDLRRVRLGFVEEAFVAERPAPPDRPGEKELLAEWQRNDLRTLDELRGIGLEPRAFALPRDLPVDALSLVLAAEAAATFDELTRSGRDRLLVRQQEQAWPNVFRQGHLVTAVDYIRANRLRTLLLRDLERRLEQVDVYVCPSLVGDNLLLTNLTGHPSVVLPNGFRADGQPTSITLVGRLHDEATLLAVAQAYQAATDHHRRRPRGF